MDTSFLRLGWRTLWRDLEIEWPGIEVILRLCDELAQARRRIAKLEQDLAERART